MATFEWRDTVRVVIGELTRADQLDLWRQLELFRVPEDEEFRNPIYVMRTDEMIAARVTRAIFVCKDGQWGKLRHGQRHTLELEDGYSLTLAFPMEPELFPDYPRSLTEAWVKASAELNGSAADLYLFFTSQSLTSGTAVSEPPQDNGQSTSQKAETSETTTSGNSPTPNTSEPG